MPAVTPVGQFLDMVRQSGVLDNHRLETHLDTLQLTSAPARTPADLARRLVDDGLLTSFQADQFLRGKWRGFLISGKYKLLEFLGAGGMGNVFLCEHIYMRRLVAVKVLPTNQTGDGAVVERFYREARAAAALDHANIVRAHDVDQDGTLHFMVMEYVDGVNLQRLVRKRGPLEVRQAADYVCQAARGLQHAFEVGWVHRDIKPANLLVDRQGTVKILDMGLARLFQDEADPHAHDPDQNCVLGTADYVAPEQVLNSRDVDIRCDIYGLGATFYYCLTGRPPFEEGTVNQKMLWHQVRRPKPVRQLRPELSEEVAAVLEMMMAKDPDKRYPTPADVLEALTPLMSGPVPPPDPDDFPTLSRVAQKVGQEVNDSTPLPANRIALPSSRKRTSLQPSPQQKRTAVLHPAPPPTAKRPSTLQTAGNHRNGSAPAPLSNRRTTQVAPPSAEPAPLPSPLQPERTTRSESDRPTKSEPRRPAAAKTAPATSRWPWWLIAGAGLVGLAAAGLAGWMILFRN